MLNISERQVYKLAAEHRIPCLKIGGSIRFDPLAVAVWLRQKMAPASASLQPAPEERLLVMEVGLPAAVTIMPLTRGNARCAEIWKMSAKSCKRVG